MKINLVTDLWQNNTKEMWSLFIKFLKSVSYTFRALLLTFSKYYWYFQMTRKKNVPSFIKFLKSVSYSIRVLPRRYPWCLIVTFSRNSWIFVHNLFLQILVLGYSELLVLPFLSCFLYHILLVPLFSSFFCRHLHLLSALGNSVFFLVFW